MTLRMGVSHCKPEPCLVYVHESSAGGDIMYVIGHRPHKITSLRRHANLRVETP